MSRLAKRAVYAALMLLSISSMANAQSLKDRIKARAKAKVGDKAEHITDTVVDSAVNKGVAVAHCVIGDKACEKKAKAAGKTVVVTDKSGAELPAAQQPTPAAAAAVAQPAAAPSASAPAADAGAAGAPEKGAGEGLWLNYDFVPGDRTIWFEDFSGDEVGDFPRRMELKEGNLEVVNYQGKKWLHSDEGGTVVVTLPETLPERFTVEAHVLQQVPGNSIVFETDDGEGANWYCNSIGGGVYGGFEKPQSNGSYPNEAGAAVDCRFTIDSRYIKAYVNEKRVGNIPTTAVVRSNKLIIQIPSGWDKEHPFMVTDIRIAAGGKKLYDALAANGRVSTHGILFDSGKDIIRPESTPTLKEIGDMLKDHPELKLMIEGHTDNVGAAASNQDLSERRAAAVKKYLVSNFGVDAARLQSKGYGASKPVASNDTSEGKQQNRRVELVKL